MALIPPAPIPQQIMETIATILKTKKKTITIFINFSFAENILERTVLTKSTQKKPKINPVEKKLRNISCLKKEKLLSNTLY